SVRETSLIVIFSLLSLRAIQARAIQADDRDWRILATLEVSTTHFIACKAGRSELFDLESNTSMGASCKTCLTPPGQAMVFAPCRTSTPALLFVGRHERPHGSRIVVGPRSAEGA